MKRMLPYRDRQWTCQRLWGKKDTNWGPKISAKMTKPSLITLLRCSIRQRSWSVSNLWCAPSGCPPSPISTHTEQKYMHTLRMPRERKAQCTILSLCCEWTARMSAERAEGKRRTVYLCACVLSWWGEGQCTTGNTVYYLWKASPSDTCSVSYLCLVYYCCGSRRRPAAGPASRYHQPTSLIGARIQIIPVFILIDDYIRKQPAVK